MRLVAVALFLLSRSTVAWQPAPTLGRRAVLSAAALLTSTPLREASAKSKEKAAEKAIQKETAKEARQAMKEYKFAPRPVLEGNAETGYTYKDGTVTAGSQGELATYFTQKGEKIRADYRAEKAKAGTVIATKETPAETKARVQSEDDKKINAKIAEFKGQKDELGRVIGGGTQKVVGDVEMDEDDLAILESLKFKGKRY